MSDPLARIDTSLLDAGFYGLLLGFLGGCKAHGLRLIATEGFRSPERSDALHAAWVADPEHAPRAAAGNRSAHNFGMAVDFLCLNRNGEVIGSSNAPEYALMEEIAPRYSLKTLRALNDGGHVELDGWELFHDVSSGNSTI